MIVRRHSINNSNRDLLDGLDYGTPRGSHRAKIDNMCSFSSFRCSLSVTRSEGDSPLGRDENVSRTDLDIIARRPERFNFIFSDHSNHI